MITSPGKVILIGAGPGDPGLITLKGKAWLQKADVVLYDFLAHPGLLAYCRPDAKLIEVGKRKGFHLKTQAQINRLLLYHAKKSPIVVRLKGGDPLLFGRGGEEIETLERHHIPYEIVPGVSSVVGVPAYAGISLTHRHLSRSVGIITGSSQKGGELGDSPIPNTDTLVILMGVTHLDDLIARILAQTTHTTDTPIALTYRGTLADQTVLTATLGTITATKPLGTPTLIVVGEVARTAQTPSWVTHLPLHGKRVILLRSTELAQDWQDTLSTLGAEVLTLPLITSKIITRSTQKLTPAYLAKFTEIVLTSPTGAKIFIDSLLNNGYDVRVLAHAKLTALGHKTAQTLQDKGLIVDRIATAAVAEGVLDLLAKTNIQGHSVLLPTAADARPILAQGLKALGAKVTVLPTYKTLCPPTAAFPIRDNDIVIFTSGSTARHFYTHPHYTHQSITACCLGEITEKTVRDFQNDRILVAKTPTLEGILECLNSARSY